MLKRGLCALRCCWPSLRHLASGASAQDKKPPYWASIASGEAMMRTGPGRNYPGIWLYKRRDLPIRVIQIYPNWRKIEDPDGEQGWMLVTLLSDRRTGIVKPGEPRNIHAKARRQFAGPLSRRAWRGRPAGEMRRHLVPHPDRQAPGMDRPGRSMGRQRRRGLRMSPINEPDDGPYLSSSDLKPLSHGMIVALIGPDGVGKSSQTAQLMTIFQKQNLKCTAIYLGSGEGGWRLRRAAKRQFRKWRGKVAESGSGAKGPTPKEYGTNHSVWTGMSGLAAALERYVSLRRAIRLARSGSLVICDRWPQNIQPGSFDGPLRLDPEAS